MFIKILLYIMEKLSSYIYGNKRAINDEEQIKKRVKISTSSNELRIIQNNNDLLDLELFESPKLRKSPTKLNLIDKNNLIETKIVKDKNGNSYEIIWTKFCEDYGFFSKNKI